MTTVVALLLVVALPRWTSVLGSRRRSTSSQPDLGEIAGLLSVGLHGGLSLTGALAATAAALDPGTADAIRLILRSAQITGLREALLHAPDPLGPLTRRLAESERTGAPLIATLDAFAREQAAASHARVVERARALPVRLTIPLTLLILPGSVLALVGPTVVDLLGQALAP